MNAMRPSQSVRNSQIALRALAAAQPELDPGAPDGVFGPQTTRAVTAFQRQSGLPETGALDAVTWDRLYDAYRALRVQSQRPAPVIVPFDAPLTAGMAHDAVLLVQFMLNRTARAFVNFPVLALTGVLDPPTETAVRRFQSVVMQPEDGRSGTVAADDKSVAGCGRGACSRRRSGKIAIFLGRLRDYFRSTIYTAQSHPSIRFASPLIGVTETSAFHVTGFSTGRPV